MPQPERAGLSSLSALSWGPMHSFPPLVVAPVYAVLYFWLCTALGRRFLSLTRLSPSGLRTIEVLLLELVAGLGTIQLLPVLLSLFSALSALAVRLGILALAVVLAADLWRVALDIAKSGRQLYQRLRTLPWSAVAWAGLLAALLAVFLVHTMFLGFTDDDGYHLAAPWRWLNEGTLSYLPSLTNTNSGMAFEMSYLVALAFDSVLGAKLLHYGTGVALLVAVMVCARRLGSWAIGAATVSMLLIATPLIKLQAIFPLAYTDLPVSLSVMVGILLWMMWRESRDPKLLWCMALCAGFTAAFKFTALAVLGAWVVLVALELYAQRRTLVQGFLDLVKFGLIAIAPSVPWFVRNWYLTGNPVYPIASSVFPTRDWSLEQSAVFSTYMKYYSWGVASGASMGEPTRKLLLLMAIAGVLIGSVIICWLVKDRRLRMLTCFSAVYILICIVLSGLIFRYWLPGIICMLLVVCTAASGMLRSRVTRPSLNYGPAMALILVAHAVQARHEMKQGTLLRDFRVAVGLSTQEREMEDDSAEQTWRFIQQNTAPDARILVSAFYSTFGASSFGCFRAQRYCVTTDSHLQTYIDLTEWPAFLRSVKQAGIQYVLMSDQQFAANRQGFSYRANDNEYPFSVRLVQRAGTKVFQAEHFQVYRLGDLDALASAP